MSSPALQASPEVLALPGRGKDLRDDPLLPSTWEHVRFYERLGLSTIPLRPRDKRPLALGWQVPSPIAWCGVRVPANLGVLTGAPGGDVVVLDFDAEALLRRWLGIRPQTLARLTLVVRTRRGYHVYARQPGARTSAPAPGFSILGAGSFAVAPPSVHPSGHVYRLVGRPTRVAPLARFAAPDLVRRVTGERPEPRPPPPPPAALPPASADLAKAEARILEAGRHARETWETLRAGPAPPGFDRSAADFAVARTLWQAGFAETAIAAVLLRLPGSKAQERGWPYAWRTACAAARRLGE